MEHLISQNDEITRLNQPRFSQFEIAEYVCGWLNADQIFHSVEDVKSALHNALHQIRDDQDGIVPSAHRRSLRFQHYQNPSFS